MSYEVFMKRLLLLGLSFLAIGGLFATLGTQYVAPTNTIFCAQSNGCVASYRIDSVVCTPAGTNEACTLTMSVGPAPDYTLNIIGGAVASVGLAMFLVSYLRRVPANGGQFQAVTLT